MNVLRGLRLIGESFLAPPPAPVVEAADSSLGQLPEVDAFVEIAVNGSRRRDSVAVNAIGSGRLLTRAVAGLRPGDAADVLYTNGNGKFRFSTVCVSVDRLEAGFELPGEIKMLESFANRRASRRVAWLGPAQWRPAALGRGSGDYRGASMMDLSAAGAAIVVAQWLRPGDELELRFRTDPEPVSIVVSGLVVRSTHVENSGKFAAGVRFTTFAADAEQKLVEFVVGQQLVRRERSVV